MAYFSFIQGEICQRAPKPIYAPAIGERRNFNRINRILQD